MVIVCFVLYSGVFGCISIARGCMWLFVGCVLLSLFDSLLHVVVCWLFGGVSCTLGICLGVFGCIFLASGCMWLFVGSVWLSSFVSLLFVVAFLVAWWCLVYFGKCGRAQLYLYRMRLHVVGSWLCLVVFGCFFVTCGCMLACFGWGLSVYWCIWVYSVVYVSHAVACGCLLVVFWLSLVAPSLHVVVFWVVW